MKEELISLILKMNPWLKQKSSLSELISAGYIYRSQAPKLLLPDWDGIWLVLVGPRQAGKTTLAKYVAHALIQEGRFENLLYLNCDFLEIRDWLKKPNFLDEAFKRFHISKPILFIDEVQRLENPGLLLKGIVDLQLPIKLMASGSSQLEIKSQVQEYLTGRHLEALILPLSYQEIGRVDDNELIYGCYPAVVTAKQKRILLQQLYKDYIQKDIIEILKVGKPDVMQKLIVLIANASGQLVNYNQLATDCKVSVPTIQHYCSLLEQTFTIRSIKPFVGNKRQEITTNPIYYFIDNGFRNQALRRFIPVSEREDRGLLIENAIFQEITKYQAQFFYDFDLYYWRTKSGAEVDFVLHWNPENIIPVEAKFRNFDRENISRGLRSFIEAYQPKIAFIITKDFVSELQLGNCLIHLIPFSKIGDMFLHINKYIHSYIN